MTGRIPRKSQADPHLPQVDTTTHQGASVCTFRLWRQDAIDEDACEAMLSALAESIRQAGGIIGHIKVLVQPLGAGSRLSITKNTVEKLPIVRQGISLEGVAIVLALAPEKLDELVSTQLWALIPEREIMGGNDFDYHW